MFATARLRLRLYVANRRVGSDGGRFVDFLAFGCKESFRKEFEMASVEVVFDGDEQFLVDVRDHAVELVYRFAGTLK